MGSGQRTTGSQVPPQYPGPALCVHGLGTGAGLPSKPALRDRQSSNPGRPDSGRPVSDAGQLPALLTASPMKEGMCPVVCEGPPRDGHLMSL